MANNEEKNQINAYRDGAFQMEVGDLDDASAIAGMLPIGGRMHIIKGDGIYRIELPDSIDPGRTNSTADLEEGSQRCALVGRTLLLAKELCREGIVAGHVDVERVLVSALEFLKEVSEANDIVVQYEKGENELVSKFRGQRSADGSLALPAMPDAEARCKKIIQSCSHAAGLLEKIARSFYPSLGKKWRDQLEKVVTGDGEATQYFKDFVKKANRFLTFM